MPKRDLRKILGREPEEIFDYEDGRVEYWLEHQRVALFEVHGFLTEAAVAWSKERKDAVRDRWAKKDRGFYVVWDLSRQNQQESAARTLAASWFKNNRKRINRMVIYLPPSPLVRMAVSVSIALVGESKNVYSDGEAFADRVIETLTYVRTHS